MRGRYPVWECGQHGTFHSVLQPLEPREPAPAVMPGQTELELHDGAH